jgi:hypothetical protein
MRLKKVACHYKIFNMEMLGNQSLGSSGAIFRPCLMTLLRILRQPILPL